jgi:hypothetical protein
MTSRRSSPILLLRRSGRRSLVRLASAAALAAAALLAPPAGAELIVLEGGRHYKASGYEVRGEQVRVALFTGGTITLPLSRVANIVDDEVMPQPEPPPASAASPGTDFFWQFADDQPVPDTPFGELIFETAKRHQLNPALVAALVRAESAYNSKAVSHKGAQGLMQLMPATARRFGLAAGESFVPSRNIEAGTRYLAWLLQRFDGDIARALAAYNAGEGTVDRFGGIPPYRETRTYVKRIYATLGLSDDPVVAALL